MTLCEERKPRTETPKIHINNESHIISKQIDEFLASGKKIKQIPVGITSFNDIGGSTLLNIAGGKSEFTKEDLQKSVNKRKALMKKTKAISGHLYIHWISNEKRFHFSIASETYYRDADKNACVKFRNKWMEERGMIIPD